MMADPFREIRGIFEAALEYAVADRAGFLDRACQGDDQLRREVQKLLAADDMTEAFIDHPALAESRTFGKSWDVVEGRRIGPYKLLKQVGRGGMGAVYLATRTDGAFEKEVAIKVMFQGLSSPDMVRRFQQERQILATLDHPNIARLLDGGTTEEGLPYLVLEYVNGRPIDDYCDERKLTVTERLKLFEKVCEAVQYAHRNLVVHRDLKPGNILVMHSATPKLVDFGIAKLLHAEPTGAAPTRTRSGIWLMTPKFASPEQVKGEPITTATDVYSLGVVLYELLTGHGPYRVKSREAHELARAICEEDPTRPSMVVGQLEQVIAPDGSSVTIRPETVSALREGTPARLRRRLAGDLDNILLLALRKDPVRRYSSVEQFNEELQRYRVGQPVRARGDTMIYRARKFVVRNKVGVTSGAAILLLLFGGVIATSVEARIAREERAGAQWQAAEARSARATAEAETREAQLQRAKAEQQAAEVERQRANADRRLAELEKVISGAVRTYSSTTPGMTDGDAALIARHAREALETLRTEEPLNSQNASLLDQITAALNSYRLSADRVSRVPAGWLAQETQPDQYRVGLDPQMLHLGKPSMFIRSLPPRPAGTAVVFQAFAASRYAGKRVRLAVFLRPQQLLQAALWLAITGDPSAEDDDFTTTNPVADFVGGRPESFERVDLAGTGPWRLHEIVMDVPRSAGSIVLGISMRNTGTLWVAHVSFEEVSSSVPLTGRQKPANLDFMKTQNRN
jgi:serine/threonine protein kinase